MGLDTTLTRAADHARQFFANLDNMAANATADAGTLRSRFRHALPEGPMAAEQVVDELVRDVEGGLLGTASGRFFAWVVGTSLPSALAADWLTSAWGQNAALYACSPAAAVVEEVVGDWLKQIFQLPQSASFALVTGCQMAHVTALAAARNALLRERGYDVEERGLAAAPPIQIVANAERHASIERAVRLLGFGMQSLHTLSATPDCTLDASSLERYLAQHGDEPTIVLLQAGDINTGAFDDFATLIPIAKRYRAWVHVDGAFGMWAAVSPQYRRLVDGIGLADSWAADGHKWLNVPFDCGYAFVRDAAAHRRAIGITAPYVAASDGLRDEIDWNPEWSRRARGFASYAALKELGLAGLRDLIERSCRHARTIVEGIAALPHTEMLWHPTLNQGLVRFLDPRSGAGESKHDAYTEAVIARVVNTGEAFFAATTWNGKRAMRVSVLNWRTSEGDVQRAVRAVASALLPLCE